MLNKEENRLLNEYQTTKEKIEMENKEIQIEMERILQTEDLEKSIHHRMNTIFGQLCFNDSSIWSQQMEYYEMEYEKTRRTVVKEIKEKKEELHLRKQDNYEKEEMAYHYWQKHMEEKNKEEKNVI